MQFIDFSKKNKKIFIGLNSGMSMDGVDLAHIQIEGDFPELKIDFLGGSFLPFPEDFRKRLLRARTASVEEVAKLDFEVAEYFVEVAREYLKSQNIQSKEIDAIGMHAQILHADMKANGYARIVHAGSASYVAEKMGLLTVSNFRQKDIAVNGNGAPLVALLDYVLYSNSKKLIALNNLGSISNVTIIGNNIDDVIASDLGPANMPIDYISEELFGRIDYEGELSLKGQVLPSFLNELMQADFLKDSLPKAAGYSEFGPEYLSPILKKYCEADKHDLLRTAVEFSAYSTYEAYEKYIFPRFPSLRDIHFSGGGVHNKTLMNRFKELFDYYNLENLAETNKNFSDNKEAIAFGLLAHETLNGRPGNVIGATNADKRVILGEIALP